MNGKEDENTNNNGDTNHGSDKIKDGKVHDTG